MAGRVKNILAQAAAETQAPEAAPVGEPAAAPSPAPVGTFGKPQVIVHKKVDGGKGVPVSHMQGKVLEPDYVEPSMRSNPEYLAKLKREKEEADAEQAKRDKAKRALGFGSRAIILGASPNSPIKQVNFVT